GGGGGVRGGGGEAGEAGGGRPPPGRRLVQRPGLDLVVGGIEHLDAVQARGAEARDRGQHGGGVVDVPERVRPDRHPAGRVDDGDRVLDRRARARDVGDRAGDEVGREERVLVSDPL